MPPGSHIERLKPKPMVPFTAARKEQYLELFRSHPDLGGRRALCAEAVGVSLSTIDYHTRHDPEFAQALEDPNVGYALTAEQFRGLSRSVGSASVAVSTGPCVVD